MTRSLHALSIVVMLVALGARAEGDGAGGGAGGGPGGDTGAEGGTGHTELPGQRPCNCNDLGDMRAMLKMVKDTRTAWNNVLADMLDNTNNAPTNGNDAKAAFYRYMGWNTSDVKDIGKVSRSGDIVVDKSFQDKHCASIVQGVQEHESAHFWYFNLRTVSIFFMDEREVGITLARSEVDSRNVQAKYLSKAIKALKKHCGRDNSSDDDDAPIKIR